MTLCLRVRAIIRIAGAMALVGAMAAAAQTPLASASEIEFLSQQAVARTLAARSPDEFAAAAAAYASLLDSGVRNGLVYFNLGTALLMAEQREAARHALAQAERYTGATWDTERNLVLAHTAPGADPAGLPWYRVPLFWHFRLATATRVTLACAAFLAIWLFATLRLCGFPRTARWGVALAAVVLVLFGSSAVTSLYQSARAPVIAASPATLASTPGATP